MAWAERDYAQAGHYFRRALELARQIPDEALLAHSLNRLGNWYSNTGSPHAASKAHHDAEEIFDRLHDQRGLAETRDLLGMASYLTGELPAAKDFFTQAVSLFREVDDRQGLVSSLTMQTLARGGALDRTVAPAGGPESVSQPAEEALAVAHEIGWEAGEVFAEFTLALAAGIRGDYAHALEYAERAQELANRIGHRQWTVAAHVAQGTVMFDVFNMDEARQHLETALAQARQMGSDNWINFTAAALAELYLATDELDHARQLLESFASDDNPPHTVARRGRLFQQAALELAAGNADGSLSLVELLMRDAPDHDRATVIPHLALLRAQALARLGRYRDAERDLLSARARALELGYRQVAWRIDLTLADLYREQGDRAGSDRALGRAKIASDELASALPDGELRDRFQRAAGELLQRSGQSQDIPFTVIDAGDGRLPNAANHVAI
jgi:tetratricopeptide (TPR) repeat protein